MWFSTPPTLGKKKSHTMHMRSAPESSSLQRPRCTRLWSMGCARACVGMRTALTRPSVVSGSATTRSRPSPNARAGQRPAARRARARARCQATQFERAGPCATQAQASQAHAAGPCSTAAVGDYPQRPGPSPGRPPTRRGRAQRAIQSVQCAMAACPWARSAPQVRRGLQQHGVALQVGLTLSDRLLCAAHAAKSAHGQERWCQRAIRGERAAAARARAAAGPGARHEPAVGAAGIDREKELKFQVYDTNGLRG